MATENILPSCNGNGRISNNGTHLMQSEVVNPKTSDFNDKSEHLLELFNLITETNECLVESRKVSIRQLLDSHPGIFNGHIDNENIFHRLAKSGEQNSELFSLFGLCSESAETCYNPLDANYMTEQQLKILLRMRYSTLGQMPIHIAVEKGFTLFVKEILRKDPSLVIQIDSDGCTPLHYAAKSTIPESLDCTKELLRVMQIENLTKMVFVARTVKEKETPVHAICSNVPTNECKVAEKLSVMLTSVSPPHANFIRDILVAYNKDDLIPLHLLSKKDVNSKENDDISNRYKLVRTMFDFMTASEVEKTTVDKLESVLHLAVKSELPGLLNFFLEKLDVNMLGKRDINGKTVFHCAAEDSLRPGKQECLKHLVNWDAFKKRYPPTIENLEVHDYFCRSFLLDTFPEDENGEIVKYTALTLACKSGSTSSVELILRNMYYANPNIQKWFAAKPQDPYTYSLNDVYKHTPGALTFLFNKAITIDLQNSNENVVYFKADLSVIEALQSPALSSVVGTQYLEYAETSPDDVQKKLLLHSLTYCAVGKTWKTKLRPFKVLWIILNITRIILLMILLPYKCVRSAKKSGTNENFTTISCYSFGEDFPSDVRYKFEMHHYVAAWILLIWALIYHVSEVRVIYCLWRSYKFIGFLIDVVQTFLAVTIAFVPFIQSLGKNYQGPPPDILKNCSVISVLLACFLMFQNLAVIHLPIGKWVEYIRKGTIEICKLLFVASPLFFGFYYSFQQMFPTVFTGELGDAGKFLAMTGGEINYSQHFQQQTDWSIGGVIKMLLFISFWIISMSYFSILLSAVFEKIRAMKKKLDVLGIRSHIRVTNYMEHKLVSKFVQLFPCIFKEGESSKEIKWFIEWNKKHSKTAALRCIFWRCCKRDLPSNGNNETKVLLLCGNGLPKTVKKAMHKLYKNKLKEQRSLNLKKYA